MIRVILPFHLRTLAKVTGEVTLDVAAPVTARTILDALEARYPTLQGTIRDYGTGKRRPLLRFFACEEDISHESMDSPLPAKIASGDEPFWIVGAIAGGEAGPGMPTSLGISPGSLAFGRRQFVSRQPIAPPTDGQECQQHGDAAENGHDPARPGGLHRISSRRIGGQVGSKKRRADKAAEEGADDAQNDRHGDAHGLFTRDEKAGDGSDKEARDDPADNGAD